MLPVFPCFPEYVFFTSWASATCVTFSCLVAASGFQEITATHGGCGVWVFRDRMFSCHPWQQTQPAMVTLYTSSKLMWSTRFQSRVTMAWLQTPFTTTNPRSSEEAEQNRLAVEGLAEPAAYCPERETAQVTVVGWSYQSRERDEQI